MQINCLIVDDEPLALDIMRTYAEKTPFLNVVAYCNNAIEAVNILRDKEVDLLFLDVQMPGLTGFDMLNTLRQKPMVVFTTAYREYAVQAFDMQAIDYLVKPITFERFLKAANRAQDMIQPHQSNDAEPGTKANGSNELGSVVYVRSGRKMLKVELDKVLFIESLKDYVTIHTPKNEFVTKQRISYLEEKLPDEQFIRVHRSFLVAIGKITSFSSTELELSNGQKIPIGRSYKESVSKHLQQHLHI